MIEVYTLGPERERAGIYETEITTPAAAIIIDRQASRTVVSRERRSGAIDESTRGTAET
jgi:hypothetical protein